MNYKAVLKKIQEKIDARLLRQREEDWDEFCEDFEE